MEDSRITREYRIADDEKLATGPARLPGIRKPGDDLLVPINVLVAGSR